MRKRISLRRVKPTNSRSGIVSVATIIAIGVVAVASIITAISVKNIQQEQSLQSEAAAACSSYSSSAACGVVPGCNWKAEQKSSCSSFTNAGSCSPTGCSWQWDNCSLDNCPAGCNYVPAKWEDKPCTISTCFSYSSCTYKAAQTIKGYCSGPAHCAGKSKSDCQLPSAFGCGWVPDKTIPASCSGTYRVQTQVESCSGQANKRCEGQYVSSPAHCEGTPIATPTPTPENKCTSGNSYCQNGSLYTCKPDKSGYTQSYCGTGRYCPTGGDKCKLLSPPSPSPKPTYCIDECLAQGNSPIECQGLPACSAGTPAANSCSRAKEGDVCLISGYIRGTCVKSGANLTCVEAKPLNSTCSVDRECSSNMCVGGVCREGGLSQGRVCTDSRQCLSKNCVQASSGPKTCQAGNYNPQARESGVGGYCGTNSFGTFTCAGGLECNSGKCQVKRTQLGDSPGGAACTSDNQCSSGTCLNNGTCFDDGGLAKAKIVNPNAGIIGAVPEQELIDRAVVTCVGHGGTDEKCRRIADDLANSNNLNCESMYVASGKTKAWAAEECKQELEVTSALAATVYGGATAAMLGPAGIAQGWRAIDTAWDALDTLNNCVINSDPGLCGQNFIYTAIPGVGSWVDDVWWRARNAVNDVAFRAKAVAKTGFKTQIIDLKAFLGGTIEINPYLGSRAQIRMLEEKYGRKVGGGAYGDAFADPKTGVLTKVFKELPGEDLAFINEFILTSNLQQRAFYEQFGGVAPGITFIDSIPEGGFQQSFFSNAVTYSQFIKKGGQLSADEILEANQTLAQIHAATGRVHGDLHPNNILVQTDPITGARKIIYIDYAGVGRGVSSPYELEHELNTILNEVLTTGRR